MEVSRRSFLKVSSATAAGTALGGLASLGANLAPTLARAQNVALRNCYQDGGRDCVVRAFACDGAD